MQPSQTHRVYDKRSREGIKARNEPGGSKWERGSNTGKKPFVGRGTECRSVWENRAASCVLNTSHQTFIEYLLHAENWKYKDKFHIIPALQ